jgi:hypothetical protein
MRVEIQQYFSINKSNRFLLLWVKIPIIFIQKKLLFKNDIKIFRKFSSLRYELWPYDEISIKININITVSGKHKVHFI